MRPPVLTLLLLFLGTTTLAQNMRPSESESILSANLDNIGITQEDLTNSRITDAYLDRTSGLKLIYLQQSFAGIPVYNVIQVLAFRDDVLVSKTGSRIYNIEEQTANKRTVSLITPAEAISIASESVNINISENRAQPPVLIKSSQDGLTLEYRPQGISKEIITVEKLWVPIPGAQVKLGWQVKILPRNTSDYWMIRVDAVSGKVLGKNNLTVNCYWDSRPLKTYLPQRLQVDQTLRPGPSSFHAALNTAGYRVVPFPCESPAFAAGTPLLVSDPWELAGPGNNATTLKWHDDGAMEYNTTKGNNVSASEDIAGNNTVGFHPTSATSLPDLTFDYNYDPASEPDVGGNLGLGITNLFYMNNVMHDLSYQYGFDEVSGNFQKNNLGRGGIAGDDVIAEAQDGSGMNNANFSVGPDGTRPRMQMFLWESDRYKKAMLNLPSNYAGVKVTSIEGEISVSNKLRGTGPVTGDLVLYDQGGIAPTDLACLPPALPASISGKIALIQQGNCELTTKVKNAQDAGAIAVLVYNNLPGQLSVMSGDDNSITIPALMIFKEDGETLKQMMNSGTVNLTLSAAPLRDGDLDNGIIAHEYTHGISNRLSGGPATVGCLTGKEQMGEGWSDYFALMATTNWKTATINDGPAIRPVGSYVIGGNPAAGEGIRSYPYSTNMSVNPLTYGVLSTFSEAEEHSVGEIWTAVLWDMTWKMIEKDDINKDIFDASGTGGNTAALKIVTLGLKLQPCNPGFLDGRDAILKADEILFNGRHTCEIWDAFARRGMGMDARQGSAMEINDQTEGFAVPASGILSKRVEEKETPQNGVLTYHFVVKSLCKPIAGYKIVDTLAANVSYVSGGVYNPTDRTVTYSVPSLNTLSQQSFTLKVKVNAGSYQPESEIFSEKIAANQIPASLIATSSLPAAGWTAISDARSAPFGLKSSGTALASEQILRSQQGFNINGHTQLHFWHKYNTQPSKDGGVVELSTDGTNWFDAGPYIALNGYNATINAGSDLDGKRAFSGVQTTYNQTIVNLSSFSGRTVYFRFRYVSDDQVSSPGWFIDDISINASPAVYNVAGLFDQTGAVRSLSDTITRVTAVVLPVVWQEFYVQRKDNTALLKWSTAQESNTKGFQVERSSNGASFQGLSFLPAKGFSDVRSAYRFVDARPAPGINFYRIKLLDQDGTYSYSETKPLVFDESAPEIVLSPNPAKEELNLYVPGNKGVLEVRILDTKGRLIALREMTGERSVIPVAPYPEGTYYLHILGARVRSVEKFVRAH